MKINEEKNIGYPRVLVSTIPAWCQYSGANTFSTLFEGYPADKLANIYTRADLPDSNVAGRYFRILESSVMKSVFNIKTKTGEEVEKRESSVHSLDALEEHKKYDFFTRHRWPIFLWLRELGWKLGKWDSKELNVFLEDFSPEVFVFSIESYWYFNRLNRYIIKKTKPRKVISYLWDDNFTYKQKPYNIISRLNRYITRIQVKNLVKQSDVILSINPKMKVECDKELGIQSILMTKPILNNDADEYKYCSGRPIRIVYSGSLVIGRDKAISILVECIKEINRSGIKIELDIYSGTALTDNQIKKLDVPGCSTLKGHLPQKEVFEEQARADILLFVENLDNKKNNVARLSFSTKITDYLSRKRAILAIGPENIAPMEYLRSEDAAITCSTKQDIIIALKSIVETPQIIEEYAQKAYKCGNKNHSRQEILTRFLNIICVDR